VRSLGPLLDHWDLCEADDDCVTLAAAGGGRSEAAPGAGLYSVSVYPLYSAVSRSLVDFVVAHNWNSFTVIYDSDDGTSLPSQPPHIRADLCVIIARRHA